ncbi:MAG: prolyl oligopeptidase family serine peptidase [Planctomycetia bacterium]|nr:prolyl oligopeptidase family serine peptidase [Planctomycetia bacterium]
MNRQLFLTLLALFAVAACDRPEAQVAPVLSPSTNESSSTYQDRWSQASSLNEARKGFQTTLVADEFAREKVPDPPPDLFRIVHYDAAAGKLAAYLSLDPNDGEKHPAIIWIISSETNSIYDVWHDAPASNDQTASAYRKAGIVMMFPSLRGGNDNPGAREALMGEVDDVVAAADFLARQDFVDAGRIYLGGHSFGGTLVLLVAESSDRFRAVFSIGPIANVAGYRPKYLPFDTTLPGEIELRSPGRWLASIKTPAFVIEGSKGNTSSVEAMAASSTNPQAHFVKVRGANHYTVLEPANRVLAEKILKDDGPECNLSVTADEIAKFVKTPAALRRSPAPDDPSWVTFKSPEGNFAVRFPVEPVSMDWRTPKGNVRAAVAYPPARKLLCLAAYTDVTLTDDDDERQSLRDFQAGMIDTQGGTLEDECELRVGEWHARELTLSSTSESTGEPRIAHIRIILAGGRIYHMMIAGYPDHVSEEYTDRFFRSFTVLEN